MILKPAMGNLDIFFASSVESSRSVASSAS